jgi:hypothetical protein
VQVTFIVIDHEIHSMVIRTLPVPWHLHKKSVLAKVKVTGIGKLMFGCLSRDDVVPELWCIAVI